MVLVEVHWATAKEPVHLRTPREFVAGVA